MYVMKELVTSPHCFMPICNIGEEGELGRVFFLHKKMKKVFIALLLTGCVLGCSKVSEISESKFDYALSTKVMSPVVEDGKLAVAILSGDTVYIGNVPGVEIEVPKYPPTTTVGSSRSIGRERTLSGTIYKLITLRLDDYNK